MIASLLNFLVPMGHPLGFLFTLLVASGCWELRRRNWRVATWILGLAAFVWVMGSRPFADWLMDGLETRFEERPLSELAARIGAVDAIVMLGGGYQFPNDQSPNVNLGEAGDRLITALELALANPSAQALAPGYRVGDEIRHGLDLFLERWGIEPERVVVMRPCGNTRDEALEIARVGRERGWDQVCVVTSAFHMRRALAVIETQGVDAVPAATDFRRLESKYLPIWPEEEAASQIRSVIREYMGFWIYSLRGWIQSDPKKSEK